MIADIYTNTLGNPISEAQPAAHTGVQRRNHNTVGQSVKRPTSEMTDAKNASRRAAKRPRLANSAAPSLSHINFARSKMFSSHPTINSRGDVTFGFRRNCELIVFIVPAYHLCTTWY